jgi:transposase
MFYGVDLHSDNVKVALLGEEEKIPLTMRCSFGSSSFEKFLKGLTKDDYIAVESSTNTFWFYDLVVERVKRCIVIDTHQFDIISKSMVKTDKRDAIHLVKFLKYAILNGETLPEVYVPPKEVREIRQLFTTYNLFKKQIVMDKNRIHSLLKQNGCKISKESLDKEKTKQLIFSLPLSSTVKVEIELIYQNIENLTEAINKVKEEILKKGKIFDKEIRILISIKGISVFTAIGIMSDVVDINRFPNAKKFCSYLRSAPKVDSSNQTTRIGKINKQSRKLSITLLIQSINHFRSCKKFDRFYIEKRKGKSAGKVRVAIARKVLVSIYNMLKREQYFYYMDKGCYEEKIKEYENFLKKVA